MYIRIYSYLTRFNLISDHQFGFRKNCSPTLAINKLYDELLTSIDPRLYSCGIFLDLSKAFDSVNHDILLQKLENFFGIRGKLQQILKSYLTNRCQYTEVGNAKSSNQKINCGVPQGSTLGPLLYIMYVNDLPSASEFSTTLFADDTYLALADNNLLRLEHKGNFQLRLVDKWLRKNKLTLNLSKITYLLFNKQPHLPISSKFNLFINQKKINKSDSVKYLGVWIDDKLNWSAHIHALLLQLAKHCSMLYHIRDFVPHYTLIMHYYIALFTVA